MKARAASLLYALAFACTRTEGPVDAQDGGASLADRQQAPDDAAMDADDVTPTDTLDDDAGLDGGVPLDSETVPDVGSPDATPAYVQITVLENGIPLSLPWTVAFHDASGAITSTTTVNARGEARGMVPPGGMWTLFENRALETVSLLARTVTGVQPGEHYVIDVRPQRPWNLITNLEVQLPGSFPGAFDYAFDLGCGRQYVGNPTPSTSYEVRDACVGTSTAVAIVATAHDRAGTILAYDVLDSVPLVFGSQAVFAGWRTDLETSTITVSGAPPSASQVIIEHQRWIGSALYASQVDIVSFDPAGAASLVVAAPPRGDRRRIRVEVQADSLSVSALRVDQGARDPADFVVGADLLPLITDVRVSTTTDAARPELRWSGGGPQADGTLLHLRNTANLEWVVLLPPADVAFQVPALPDAYASFRSRPESSTRITVTQVESDDIADYVQLRRLRTQLLLPDYDGILTPGTSARFTRGTRL